MAFRRISSKLDRGDVAEASGLRRGEVQVDAIDVRADDEHIHLQPDGEQRRCEVLVHHRLGPEQPGAVAHHRDPTAAERDDDDAGVDEGSNRRLLDDVERLG